MKRCSCCKIEKPLAEFGKKKQRGKDYIRSYCKKCDNLKRSEWRAKNLERDNAIIAAWGKRNQHKRTAIEAQRRAQKRKAVPAWADLDAIRAIYEEARLKTEQTGIPHHVDHLVPLKSKLVCGFHVEHNLRVVPASENVVKGNRHWPDQ